jgi:urease beta subunit
MPSGKRLCLPCRTAVRYERGYASLLLYEASVERVKRLTHVRD